MNIKRVVISSVASTVFYFAIYVIFRDYLTEHCHPMPPCKEGESCVRFCCTQEQMCANDADFNISRLPMAKNLTKGYKILKGKTCAKYHQSEFFEETHQSPSEDESSMDPELFGFNPENSFKLLPNGSALDYGSLITPNEYCIQFDAEVGAFVPYTCAPIHSIEEAKHLYPWLMIASVPFLITTFVVYCIIKDLRTLHGKCVMSYVLSLTVMYSSLAVLNMYNSDILKEYVKTCKLLGYLMLSTILMCFFWLNVMCYDTWSTLRKTKIKGSSKKKFIRYCMYAFGTPIVSVFTVFILNEFEVIPLEWRTGIGNLSCTVSDPVAEFAMFDPEITEAQQKVQFLYLFGPILVLLIMNFVFYSTTTYTIWKAQQMFKSGDMCRHVKKEGARFGLYIRFFIMMGLPWVIEVISWFMYDSLFLYVASIINCLQGFIIFVMFVTRSKIFNMLKKRSGQVATSMYTVTRASGQYRSRAERSVVYAQSKM